jgi:hypothetical protein
MKIDIKTLQAQHVAAVEKFLQELTAEVAEKPTLVVIGGFAMRAHGAKGFSHDGDIMVDQPTYGALRDRLRFNLSRNPRLGKNQFTAPAGFEVDVYVENQHKLRVPFDEVQAYGERKNNLWVACAEHLLILKLDALKDRRHTDKGEKDIDDILVLMMPGRFEHADLLKQHMRPEDWELLAEVVENPGNWQRLTENNYKEAATLREAALATLKLLQKA